MEFDNLLLVNLKSKLKICNVCGKARPHNRKYFQRVRIDGREVLKDTCRACIGGVVHNKHWKDGKLLCLICKNYLEVDNFCLSKDRDYRGGRDGRCRNCRSLQSTTARVSKEGEELVNRVILERFLSAQDRTRKRNLEFNITKEFLKELIVTQDNKCAISGLEFTYILGKGRCYQNLSIDRKDATKGYTMDNTQLVCMAVNQMKSDLDLEDLIIFCEAIVANAKKWKH